jgi:formylglycine-generating enzyme required for sulfatase activity
MPNGADLIYVEGGTFMMGSDEGDSDEEPIHEVTLTYDYYIGKYEVTFDEYDLFCEDTGRNKPSDQGWGRWRHPVINVDWHDAVEYCNWLSKKDNLPIAYDHNGNFLDKYGRRTNDVTQVVGYRLPTETEWEYAARGGKYSTGYIYAGHDNVKEVAWYDDNSGGHTHEVGTKEPNELGIYDMSGNVYEWCQDWYDRDYYEISPDTNPYNYKKGSSRVLRGGSWDSITYSVRVANRGSFSPGYADNSRGFRVCRTAY